MVSELLKWTQSDGKGRAGVQRTRYKWQMVISTEVYQRNLLQLETKEHTPPWGETQLDKHHFSSSVRIEAKHRTSRVEKSPEGALEASVTSTPDLLLSERYQQVPGSEPYRLDN